MSASGSARTSSDRHEFLAQAEWLDEARVTGYAFIFAGLFALTAIVWIALSPGLSDPNGNRLDKPERLSVRAQIEKPVFAIDRR